MTAMIYCPSETDNFKRSRTNIEQCHGQNVASATIWWSPNAGLFINKTQSNAVKWWIKYSKTTNIEL
jgi:hypothetical protein